MSDRYARARKQFAKLSEDMAAKKSVLKMFCQTVSDEPPSRMEHSLFRRITLRTYFILAAHVIYVGRGRELVAEEMMK